MEPRPRRAEKKDPHADADGDSPDTRRKKANMRDYLKEQAEDEKRPERQGGRGRGAVRASIFGDHGRESPHREG